MQIETIPMAAYDLGREPLPYGSTFRNFEAAQVDWRNEQDKIVMETGKLLLLRFACNIFIYWISYG
jgi:hypothetical protein